MPLSSPKNVSNDRCPTCQDIGYILVDNWTARECACLEQKQLQARLKLSLIPKEFEQATFKGYHIQNQVQRKLYEAAVQYIKQFPEIQHQKANSLGFIARIGEEKIRSVSSLAQKKQMKAQHNNFGLGKTHLQMAMAKNLMRNGICVLSISDASFMDELMSAKASQEQQAFPRLLEAVTSASVLVWDDIGKANPTEAKRSAYFRIINERSRKRLPIIYSSNEDMETLSFRIGDAATSRLFGMSEGRIYPVEGPDYRIFGQKKNPLL